MDIPVCVSLVLLLAVLGVESWKIPRNNLLEKGQDQKVQWHANCEQTEALENGYFTDYQTYRGYACVDDTYELNIPANIKFICKKGRKDGLYRWTSKAYPSLDFTHVRCTGNMEPCPEPPTTAHARIDYMVRYKLPLLDRRNNVLQDSGYYTGDELKYSCAVGYGVESTDKDTVTLGQYEDYSDDDADNSSYVTTEEPYTVTTTYRLICDVTGRWIGSGLEDIHLPECKAIQCDASEFANVTYGQILNHSSLYDYQGEMKVECDFGYTPIDGVDTLVCLDFDSFYKKFGCEAIRCPKPTRPEHAIMKVEGDDFMYNTTVSFYCDDTEGYTLIGQPVWTCGEDGLWGGHTCVTCQRKGSYCPTPCVPIGASLTMESDYSEGSEIEFTCDGTYVSGSVKRKCLRNRQWSGRDMDCSGESLVDPNVVGNLRAAMYGVVELARSLANISDLNNTNEDGSRTINVGRVGGVDVYFLIDISGSITKNMFDSIMKFIAAIVPTLGVSDSDDGTRLALYLFAENVIREFNQHHLPTDANEVFKNPKEAMETINDIDRADLNTKQKIGLDTDLGSGLAEIITDVETKLLDQNLIRDPQNVLILMSDGKYTVGGDPKEKVEELKNKYKVEIYSIAVGRIDKDLSSQMKMKEISSEAETGEQHFFSMDSMGADMNEFIKLMISNDVIYQCGATRPDRTATSEEISHDTNAKAHAWPWMAQIRTVASVHKCGGSLIDERHILTAAHCLYDVKSNNEAMSVVLKRHTLEQQKKILPYEVPSQDMFIHDKYIPDNEPKHNYDIAILRLPEKVHFDSDVHPVCLWNETYAEPAISIKFEDLYKEDTFGVVTGWGSTKDDKNYAPTLKQMQMNVKADGDCTKNLNDDEKHKVNITLMFCAGGRDDDNKIIDSCHGDSGGPFVVRKGQTDTYIQTGIVSFGIGGCRKEGRYGLYTRLVPEMLDWIAKTIKTA